MGLLLMFAAGYAIGARAGRESLDDVVDAVHAICESEEFHDFVKALRRHAADSLRGLASMLEHGQVSTDGRKGPSDLLDRVRVIVGQR